MATDSVPKSSGDSAEQREVEKIIREGVEQRLGILLNGDFPIAGPEPDGFWHGDRPVIVEIWAHQGRAKSAQKGKLMIDASKLVLCERLLKRPCRKILAVSDGQAIFHLAGSSWQGLFLKEFDIETMVIPLDAAARERVLQAQIRQFR